MTAVRVTESSGSVGTIQVSSGTGGFKPGRIVAGSNVTISSSSEGVFEITSTATGSTTNVIGTPTDGSYSGGLFSNFSPTTTIADAIDQINAILSYVAPEPAPSLTTVSTSNVGASARLSFGVDNEIDTYTPVGSIVLGSANVNDTFQFDFSSDNKRLGVFDGSVSIVGTLNDSVPSRSPNYTSDAFGSAESGYLKLELNGEVIHQVDLSSDVGAGAPGSGTGEYLNSSGSGFTNLSATGSAVDETGRVFDSILHRTANFKIHSNDQVNGWNYARIIHSLPTVNLVTNYIEWVNDDNNDAITVSSTSLDLDVTGSVTLSGVQYFNQGTYTYSGSISNVYTNVYSSENITFTSTNLDTNTFSIPEIGEGADQNKVISITTSAGISNQKLIDGNVSLAVNVPHPIKDDLSSGGQENLSGILYYTLSDNSSINRETFRSEQYRVISGSYDTQADVTSGSWNSTVHMTTASFYVNNYPGHSDGMLVFDGLYSPTNFVSGDFRNTSAGGTLSFAPDGNPDYSYVTTGIRTYYRKFTNTGDTVRDFKVYIAGSTALVNSQYELSSNRIKLFAKLPDNGTSSTDWLDLSKAFVYNETENNDGAYVGNYSATINGSVTNLYSIGTKEIENGDAIILKIESPASWSGRIDELTVTFGAGEGSFDPVPDLNELTSAYQGSSLIKLSFGASNNIAGYENVTEIGDFVEKDINDLYAPSESKLLGVFNGETDIHFLINDSVVNASPNHAADVFSEGNDGSIILEVNGQIIDELSLTGSYNAVGQGSPGSGYRSHLNASGSGFYHVSTWEAGKYSNNVPDFTEIQRSAKCMVVHEQQRNGMNYARVIHTGSFGSRVTNYVQWVNDTNTDAVNFSNLYFSNFEGDGAYYLSGIKYFDGHISGSFSGIVRNAYKHVYSAVTSAITIFERQNMEPRSLSVSGSGIESDSKTFASSMPLPDLKSFDGAEDQDMIVSASFRSRAAFDESYPEDNDSADFKLRILHPLKEPANSPSQGKSKFLIFSGYSGVLSSNINTEERFLDESFRIQSSSFTSQASVTNADYDWNSEVIMNLTSSAGYTSGLAFYRQKLQSPTKIGESGDFRNVQEGGTIQSPFGNPNYSSSSLLASTRTFFRPFKNNTASDRPNLTLTLYGDANIVGRQGIYAGTIGNNKNVYVDVKIPGKTGFLDMGRPSDGAGNTTELDGCLSGDLVNGVDSAGASNTVTFNGQTVDGTSSSSGEYIVVRITADKLWAGYLDRISVSWS